MSEGANYGSGFGLARFFPLLNPNDPTDPVDPPPAEPTQKTTDLREPRNQTFNFGTIL